MPTTQSDMGFWDYVTLDGNLIGGASFSLMSAGPNVYSGGIASQLTTYDLTAVQTAYGAGIKAGDRRSDFVAAGVLL
jgi:hypothetical protein